MKKIFSFLFLGFLLTVAVFGIFFTKWIPEYDSEISSHIAVKNAENVFEVLASEKQNSWYLGFDKSLISEKFPQVDNFCVQFFINNENFYECLDVEHEDNTGEYYTFPIVTDLASVITFEIFYNGEKISDFDSVSVYSLNTLPVGKKLAFSLDLAGANNAVISRAGWGADETLRYANHPRQIAVAQAAQIASQKTKTATQVAAAKKTADINAFVGQKLSDFVTTERITHENGNKLVWPIQKVNKVNKIVVHHTADKIDNRTDEEMLRAIYSYHAVTRGWGDIGYNYIIGRDGRVYEGRAGGDYVVGAHASYNNIGSVGISLLGTYDTTPLNSLQENSLKNLVYTLSQKYNININDSVMGFYPCSVASCYPIKVVYTKALLGHRDVGVTSCPGNAIYNQLGNWRNEIASYAISSSVTLQSAPTVSQNNNILPLKPTISGMFGDGNVRATTTSVTTALSSMAATTYNTSVTRSLTAFEKSQLNSLVYDLEKIGVKLSYPKEPMSITLRPFDGLSGVVSLDGERYSISGNTDVVATLVNGNLSVKIGNQAEKNAKTVSLQSAVVEIPSWTRKPEWDTKNRYNDNIFRDTIEVSIENNSLLVVNRLPLEYYLKGLGEVSDGDLPEKIKTITVAARGYAKFYMQSQNRKYGTPKYDGSDDPDSFQKYLGYDYERRSPNVSKMVDATAGEVIYHNNILIKPWYFSRSGGRTLSYLDYCTQNNGKNCENISYLQSVADPGGLGESRSGHGVGISGIGATHFARNGWDYKKIIQYYLNGVEIRK